MLNAALHFHLRKYFLLVVADIENDLYVDNVISCCDSKSDAVAFYNESRSILSEAKFNLQS